MENKISTLLKSFVLFSIFGICNIAFAQLSAWNYIAPIVITETSGSNLTNYETLLIVDTQTPIGAGKMNIDGSKYTGFDSDGTDYRIFLGWAFGKVGFGSDGTNQEFTVGATYGVLDNLSLDLDYVMGTGTGDANLRMALQVHF